MLFYSSKSPENKYFAQKYYAVKLFLTLILQIRMLEWFLEDHVTLKTEVVAVENSAGINYILKPTKKENIYSNLK